MQLNHWSTWGIFLGLILIGVVAGFFIGAWIATRHDVIASAEKILREVGG